MLRPSTVDSRASTPPFPTLDRVLDTAAFGPSGSNMASGSASPPDRRGRRTGGRPWTPRIDLQQPQSRIRPREKQGLCSNQTPPVLCRRRLGASEG
jgi:hypothetical protein